MLLGGDPGTVLQQKQDGSGSAYEETTDGKDYSKVDTDLVQFAKQILAGAEDVRTKEFEKKREDITKRPIWSSSMMRCLQNAATPLPKPGLFIAVPAGRFTSTCRFSKTWDGKSGLTATSRRG